MSNISPQTGSSSGAYKSQDAFLSACQKGQGNLVELILDRAKPDLNIRTKEGLTCLHLAVLRNNVEVVKMLIEAGVDTTSRTNSGHTALELAAEHSSLHMLHSLRGMLTPSKSGVVFSDMIVPPVSAEKKRSGNSGGVGGGVGGAGDKNTVVFSDMIVPPLPTTTHTDKPSTSSTAGTAGTAGTARSSGSSTNNVVFSDMLVPPLPTTTTTTATADATTTTTTTTSPVDASSDDWVVVGDGSDSELIRAYNSKSEGEELIPAPIGADTTPTTITVQSTPGRTKGTTVIIDNEGSVNTGTVDTNTTAVLSVRHRKALARQRRREELRAERREKKRRREEVRAQRKKNRSRCGNSICGGSGDEEAEVSADGCNVGSVGSVGSEGGTIRIEGCGGTSDGGDGSGGMNGGRGVRGKRNGKYCKFDKLYNKLRCKPKAHKHHYQRTKSHCRKKLNTTNPVNTTNANDDNTVIFHSYNSTPFVWPNGLPLSTHYYMNRLRNVSQMYEQRIAELQAQLDILQRTTTNSNTGTNTRTCTVAKCDPATRASSEVVWDEEVHFTHSSTAHANNGTNCNIPATPTTQEVHGTQCVQQGTVRSDFDRIFLEAMSGLLLLITVALVVFIRVRLMR